MRTRVSAWSLALGDAEDQAQIKGADPLGLRMSGLALDRLYRQGRRRLRGARKSSHASATHELRKRVKDLRYGAEMLTHDGRPKRIRRIGRDADRLGELLGKEHDLVLLADRVQANAELFADDRKARRLLLRAIKRHRKRLRKRALQFQPSGYIERKHLQLQK